MNDFSELEAELKKLRLAPISDELSRLIERALETPGEIPTAGVLRRPPQRSTGWWSFGLGLTGIAALLVLGLTFFDQPPPAQVAAEPKKSTPAPGFHPAGLSQVVYSGRDEGLVFPPNDSGTLRRRLRYETRETMRWSNAQTGASVRVSYPVEQVVLTPVSFQ
jgi:hypothetical protein